MKLIERLDGLRERANGKIRGVAAEEYYEALDVLWPAFRDVAWAASFVSRSPDLKERCPHLAKILNDALEGFDDEND